MTTTMEATATPRPMRIACLGWGSLLWKPGALPLASGWQAGGPPLPLEFARVSDGGELAIVLCEGAPDAPTWWAELDLDDLDRARELLREREQIDPRWAGLVGSLPAEDGDGGPWHARIAAWTEERGIDGVVWTALPPKSPGGASTMPTADEAIAYLRGLQGERAEHAERYVRQVPADIRTPYRRVIEERLGWTPQEAAAQAG
jgi:hypothetical protein